MVQVTLFLSGITVLLILFGYSSELELTSEELATVPRVLTAVVPFGKRLKLIVQNLDNYGALLWRFNGESVSEKCEMGLTSVVATLICTDMHWSDAGRYEYLGITKSGQTDILLAVDVKIAECTEQLATKQRIELAENVSQESETCFCSGITDECSMADDLFRIKITASVTEEDLVDLMITETTVEESWSLDSESELSTYYSLPRVLKGNLLKSYGGYMDFPSTDDKIDADKPDLVLQSKSRTLVHFARRKQVVSEELSGSRVHMTEQNWRQLNNSAVSRDTFLTVLSNVKNFYVKSNQSKSLELVHIGLDSADFNDHDLGKVSTVEKCRCRPGYSGLSCESCSRGFYRRTAVRREGICVSVRDKLEPLVFKLKHQFDQIQNNYRQG